MADLTDLYDETDDGVLLQVHVQPGAGRSAVVGRHGDALKVRVAAPPVEGRANEATEALLAEALGLDRADVELTSGATSRSKRYRLRNIDAEEFDKRLRVALDAANAPEGGTGGRRR
ncbi:MAG: DUF167 domain-containing protein [Acidimicrobiia bacterium]